MPVGMTQDSAVQHLEQCCEQLRDMLAERTLQLAEARKELEQEAAERLRVENCMRNLRERLEQEERARIARDIHDSIGQSLLAMKLNLKMQREQCHQGRPCRCEALDGTIAELTRVGDELRDIIISLRPEFLITTPLHKALEWLCDKLSRRTGLSISLAASGDSSDLSDEIKLALFRICQEALSNAVKHGAGSAIKVALAHCAETVRLSVIDDGRGGAAGGGARGGRGILIMRERAELVGASFELLSPAGCGTMVTVEVPLP